MQLLLICTCMTSLYMGPVKTCSLKIQQLKTFRTDFAFTFSLFSHFKSKFAAGKHTHIHTHIRTHTHTYTHTQRHIRAHTDIQIKTYKKTKLEIIIYMGVCKFFLNTQTKHMRQKNLQKYHEVFHSFYTQCDSVGKN